ncbi:MAG: serine--tRNA ligase [Bacteroidetes bacterium]|nr:serine--tRNA ligase [Bacteroidota bacterium]
MLQVQVLRDDTKRVIEGLAKRNLKDAEELVNQAIENDKQRRKTQLDLDELKAKSNANSKKIGELIKDKKTDEANDLKNQVTQAKDQIKTWEENLLAFEKKLQDILYKIPNVPHEKVPAGKSPEDNKNVHQHGTPPTLYAGALPHWELIKKYDIIDFDLGVKISSAGFPVYKGKGAKLQRALINFFLAEAEKAEYIEIQPPIVVNEASGYGTGQLPDKEGQMYFVNEDGLYLIPTAEVPITGAHVRGLNRLHQFDKVEVVQITQPENSYQVLDEMCDHVQGLLEKLELPYRKLLLCGGDMGFNSAMTYDFEVFSAAQQRWLEVSSVSNFETFQANRLKLRYKNREGKTQLLHTLNGSALALPRIVAAILENNQTEVGIKIPEALRKYTGFDWIN